jgi:hypothetical protein
MITNQTRPQVVIPPSPPAVRRPSRRGYWIGSLIIVVGIVAGLAWGLGAYRSYQRQIESFDRFTVPGQVDIGISTPGERVLYFEGTATVTADQLGITVTAPDGSNAAVAPYTADLRYDAPDGTVGRAIGSFEAGVPGEYRIAATAGPAAGQIAVGEVVPTSTIASVVGAVALICAGGCIGLIVLIATAVRRSRR